MGPAKIRIPTAVFVTKSLVGRGTVKIRELKSYSCRDFGGRVLWDSLGKCWSTISDISNISCTPFYINNIITSIYLDI